MFRVFACPETNVHYHMDDTVTPSLYPFLFPETRVRAAESVIRPPAFGADERI